MPKNWASDKVFKVRRVRRAYRFDACYRAVLIPTLGVRPSQVWNEAEMDIALDRLRYMWRSRLVALRSAGWAILKTGKNNIYARNCPPFGVLTDSVSRPCNRPKLCPFCYARQYVYEPFSWMQKALYGSLRLTDPQTGERLVPREGLRLVGFKTGMRYVPPDVSEKAIHDAATTLYDTLHAQRRAEMDLVADPLGFTFLQVYPTRHKGGLALIGRRVGLALTRSDKLPEGVKVHKKDMLEMEEFPNKKKMAQWFGRVMAYPKQMLFASPRVTVNVLRALAGRHCMVRYGFGRQSPGPSVPPDPSVCASAPTAVSVHSPDAAEALAISREILRIIHDEVSQAARKAQADLFVDIQTRTTEIVRAIESRDWATTLQCRALDEMLVAVRRWVTPVENRLSNQGQSRGQDTPQAKETAGSGRARRVKRDASVESDSSDSGQATP